MARVKRSYSRGEVVHAWVNSTGLVYYNSNSSYNSLTGINNVLFVGDAKYRYKEGEDNLIDYPVGGVIAIIDRERKRLLINQELGFDNELERAVNKEEYDIYYYSGHDNSFINPVEVISNDDWLCKNTVKYYLTFYHQSIQDMYLYVRGHNRMNIRPYLVRENVKAVIEHPKRLLRLTADYYYTKRLCEFLEVHECSKYDWYDKSLGDIHYNVSSSYTASYKKLPMFSLKSVVNKTVFTKAELKLIVKRLFYTKYCYNNQVITAKIPSKTNPDTFSVIRSKISFKDVCDNWDKLIDGVKWQLRIIELKDEFEVIFSAVHKEVIERNNKLLEESTSANAINVWRETGKAPEVIVSLYDTQGSYSSIDKVPRVDTKLTSPISSYYELRLVNDTVITTANCRCDVKVAERLYRLFLRIIRENGVNTKWEVDLKDKNLKAGIYPVNRIVCDYKRIHRYIQLPDAELEPCIIIGCHTLYLSNIRDFIKYYNLKWED